MIKSSIDDIFSKVGNYFSNRRVPTKKQEDTLEYIKDEVNISIDHLSLINGRPPMYDNIVDPPIESSEDDYQNRLTTLYSSTHQPSVGRAYVKNFLMNGNFVTLVPLKLNISAGDIARGKMQGALSALETTARVTNIGTLSPKAIWENFNSAIDIGSYGYTTSVASKRYWRHVAANMKVILFGLGIDIREDRYTKLPSDEYVRSCMPKWITDNIFSAEYLSKWSMDVEDTAANEVSGHMTTSERDEYKELNARVNSNKIEQDKAKYSRNDAEVNRLGALIKKDQDKMKTLEVNTTTSNDYQEFKSKEVTDQFYDSLSMQKLKQWILAVGSEGEIQQNLPMVTFYVNGAIEKSYGVSQSVGESALGAAISGNFAKDLLQNVSQNAANSDNKYVKAAGAVGMDLTGGGIPEEMSYLSSSSGNFANAFVPKVNKGVDGDISYNIPIRSIADGSDPISLAMHLYNIALLMPFYIEPSSRKFKHSFVPSSPLILSAFSKGIFNIPRGVITNIDIKSDPVFQTTESISTDLEINLTITPFINKGFSPDFDTFFNRSGDETNMVMAMFNPFSSFNILVTMCGLNTTMTKINYGIFEYIFLKQPTSLVNIAFESWAGLKSSLVDIKSTTIRNLNSAKAVRTN